LVGVDGSLSGQFNSTFGYRIYRWVKEFKSSYGFVEQFSGADFAGSDQHC
tara:strand:- start:294 stop:443 length:150 start_codon:yes stop_codon:yes gene_type:complete